MGLECPVCRAGDLKVDRIRPLNAVEKINPFLQPPFYVPIWFMEPDRTHQNRLRPMRSLSLSAEAEAPRRFGAEQRRFNPLPCAVTANIGNFRAHGKPRNPYRDPKPVSTVLTVRNRINRSSQGEKYLI